MALGAYPIQSNTSCASEWIDKESGLISNLYDLNIIERKILDVINDETVFAKAFDKISIQLRKKLIKKYIADSNRFL